MLVLKDDKTGMLEFSFEITEGRLHKMMKKKWFKKLIKFLNKRVQTPQALPMKLGHGR